MKRYILAAALLCGCAPTLAPRPAAIVSKLEPASLISAAAPGGDSSAFGWSVNYDYKLPPEENLVGRDLLTVTYHGSGRWDYFPIPPYYHFMQIYCVGRPFGKELKVFTLQERPIMSSIGPAAAADIAGWPAVKMFATQGTAWIVRMCR